MVGGIGGFGLPQNSGYFKPGQYSTPSNNAFKTNMSFAAGDTSTSGTGSNSSGTSGTSGGGSKEKYTLKDTIQLQLYGTTAKHPNWMAFFGKVCGDDEKPVKVAAPEGFTMIDYEA